MDKLIDSRELHGGDELRIEISTYRGREYIGLRRWYLDGETRKAGKGLSVSVGYVPFLRQALQRAEQHALEHNLLAEEDYELIDEQVPAKLLGEAA